jgi:hypothetical protein
MRGALLAVLGDRGILDVPLYITEAGNACDPHCDPYPDADTGHFAAMYEEMDSWNLSHPDQTVRAVTPYRWTLNDDGTGRDFCIGCAAGLRSDLPAHSGSGCGCAVASWGCRACARPPRGLD